MHHASHDSWLLEDLQPDWSLVEAAPDGVFVHEVSSRRALMKCELPAQVAEGLRLDPALQPGVVVENAVER
eukprot:4678752-Heterocapsa_arctica.AAC.1